LARDGVVLEFGRRADRRVAVSFNLGAEASRVKCIDAGGGGGGARSQLRALGGPPLRGRLATG